MTFDPPRFRYRPPPGLTFREPLHKVAVVGAGPIGLAVAIELANHDVPTVLLDDNDTVSVGSRAICWSKRSLEIFDRLGIGDRAVEKGVIWKVGRTYYRERELFNFDLLPESGHKRPAFINLQQYYVEAYLAEQARHNSLIDLRFRNKVTGVVNGADRAVLTIDTPDGDYELEAEFVVACDGARSPVREMLGQKLSGAAFEDRFLIADIELKADFPSERRFYFQPVFHAGQSALLHKQPDSIYRIDLQLGPDADAEEERKPERVIPRIERVLGRRDFRLEWVSVYTFQCRRLDKFLNGRVIFAGDSAHVVSPFGARGGNGGLQDVDCLGWRLAAVIKGDAPKSLLEAYEAERIEAADENILESTRTTGFMTPSTHLAKLARNGILHLARFTRFARPWVNSGRLSVPCVYTGDGADSPKLPRVSRPGAVAPDAPQGESWLIDLIGKEPVILGVGCEPFSLRGARSLKAEMNQFVRDRYLGSAEKAVYLLRPDQVVYARWESPKKGDLVQALDKLWGRTT